MFIAYRFLKLSLLLSLIMFSFCSCKQQNKNIDTDTIAKEDTATFESFKEMLKEEENYNQYDKFDLLKQGKAYFPKYIKSRLKELDPEGFAYEYEEAREFYIGDINLDKIPDVIVLYTIEGAGGGNNFYRYILFLINNGTELASLNHAMVYGTLEGEAEFVGIKDGYVIFNKIDFLSDDMSAKFDEKYPTKYKRVGYGVRGDNLVINELD